MSAEGAALVMFRGAAPSALIESTTLIPTLRSGLFTSGPSDLIP